MRAGRRSAFAILGELIVALWHKAIAPFRIFVRASWPYRLSLRGRMPDRIVIHPLDVVPRRLEDADAILRGKFRFAGETVEAKQGTSIFQQKPPSLEWAVALHSFDWLAPLSMAGGETARITATELIAQWLKHNGHYSE